LTLTRCKVVAAAAATTLQRVSLTYTYVRSRKSSLQWKASPKPSPSAKKFIKNIWLSFFYGAKIGVLGLNGSGKSTLLKLIAGLDTNYEGRISFR
jgi:ABC-type polysaccharide/polyol phosphate transport system ATPase subunit